MRTDRGTTLLLFPAAVLVMMILGAIAVDLGNVQLARRQLVSAAGAAADDASDQLSVASVRSGGPFRLDPDAARRRALDDLARADLPGHAAGRSSVVVDPTGRTVTVTIARDVPHIFGRAIPGVPDSQRVTVTISARLHEPAP